MFSRFSTTLSRISRKSTRLFSSCQYEAPFLRFGYMGAMVIGGGVVYISRLDHCYLLDELVKMKSELKEIKKLLSENKK